MAGRKTTRIAKSTRSLPAKKLSAKKASGVKGGASTAKPKVFLTIKMDSVFVSKSN